MVGGGRAAGERGSEIRVLGRGVGAQLKQVAQHWGGAPAPVRRRFSPSNLMRRSGPPAVLYLRTWSSAWPSSWRLVRRARVSKGKRRDLIEHALTRGGRETSHCGQLRRLRRGMRCAYVGSDWVAGAAWQVGPWGSAGVAAQAACALRGRSLVFVGDSLQQQLFDAFTAELQQCAPSPQRRQSCHQLAQHRAPPVARAALSCGLTQGGRRRAESPADVGAYGVRRVELHPDEPVDCERPGAIAWCAPAPLLTHRQSAKRRACASGFTSLSSQAPGRPAQRLSCSIREARVDGMTAPARAAQARAGTVTLRWNLRVCGMRSTRGEGEARPSCGLLVCAAVALAECPDPVLRVLPHFAQYGAALHATLL